MGPNKILITQQNIGSDNYYSILASMYVRTDNLPLKEKYWYLVASKRSMHRVLPQHQK